MNHKLSVIKIGGKDLFNHPGIYMDLANLIKRGEKIVLITGGSFAISEQFASENKTMTMLEMQNGDRVRFCGKAELLTIEKAYRTRVFPHVRKQLLQEALSCLCLCAGDGHFVTGKAYPPLKVKYEEGFRLEKKSRVGNVINVASEKILKLLDVFDIIVFSPLIISEDGGFLNIDADMLAAHLAIELKAAYLHFLTSTSGILSNIADPNSTVSDIYLEEAMHPEFVQGRMKQKLRAALLAITSSQAFTTISSSQVSRPITEMDHSRTTHLWKIKPTNKRTEYLVKMSQIPSVSQYENRLARYMAHRLSNENLSSIVDAAGNIVTRIGKGHRKLLFLSHIDTVPGNISVNLEGNILKGRGTVDAKGTYAAYLEAAASFQGIENTEILVIGAVEEEISSAKGGIFVRENYQADAVVIGEPSHTKNITLGYNGMFKVELKCAVTSSHSAAKDYQSPSDILLNITQQLIDSVKAFGEQNISIREFVSGYENHQEHAKVAINFRISPTCELAALNRLIQEYATNYPEVKFEVLRQAPGALFEKTTSLANAFYRSIKQHQEIPRFVFKTGTSYMNTLKTSWSCPMIAYGPGDSALDHTEHEHILLSDFEKSVSILKQAIQNWINTVTN